jgi:SET domain-containing protein
LEPVIVTSRGSLLPRVALFAARDIAQGEELTFSYAVSGNSTAAAGANGAAESGGTATAAASRRRCYCRAAVCPGFLPSA